MTTQEHRSITRPAVWTLGLFAVGLALLGVGHFVQFSDVSGSGSEEWIFPLGYLAAAFGVASVVVAWRQPAARLWLGALIAVLVVFLVWQVVANGAFRFVWASDEGELLVLQVALGVLALALIATGLQPTEKPEERPGAGRWLVRAVIYLAGILLTACIVFLLGTAYYENTQCSGDTGDCLAPLGGFVWGLVSVPVCLVVVVVIELVLRSRRRQHRG